MDVAIRAAIDRLMYEQAVALHMLDLAGPGALERELPGSGRRAAEIFGEAEATLRRIEALLGGGQPGEEHPAAAPDITAGLRTLLRRVFGAASGLGERRPSEEVLGELWNAAAIYTVLRADLLSAFPESAEDPVVRRWQRAPEPPAHPPHPAAVDDGEGPG